MKSFDADINQIIGIIISRKRSVNLIPNLQSPILKPYSDNDSLKKNFIMRTEGRTKVIKSPMNQYKYSIRNGSWKLVTKSNRFSLKNLLEVKYQLIVWSTATERKIVTIFLSSCLIVSKRDFNSFLSNLLVFIKFLFPL